VLQFYGKIKIVKSENYRGPSRPRSALYLTSTQW